MMDTMDTKVLLTVIALVVGVIGAIPVIDKIRNKKLTKKYKRFVKDVLVAIFGSEKINSTTNSKDIQHEVKAIVQKISNRYFNESLPPSPADPIREAIFGEDFSYRLKCNICKELHQPDAKGRCRHCGLPAPFWCMLAFKSLKEQHILMPSNRMNDRYQNGQNPQRPVEFPDAPSSSDSQGDKNH